MTRSSQGTTDTSLLRSTALYGAANAVQRFIPALLLPITTRFLTPTDFGIMAIFSVIVRLTTPFTGLNTPYAVRRKYFDQEETHFPTYVATCLVILGGSALATGVVVWPLAGMTAAATGLPVAWAMAAVAMSAGQVFLRILLTIWQAQRLSLRYTVLQTSRSAYQATLTILLVVGLGFNWRGALAARLLTTLTFVVAVGLPAMRTWAVPRIDANHARHAVRYGGGLIPHTLSGLAITSADRFFISHFAGPAETGLYSVAFQIGFLVALAADAFNQAWSPWLYQRLKEGDEAGKRRAVQLTYGSFGAMALMAALVSLAAPFVVRYVLGAPFRGAEAFIAWIAGGFALNGMYRIVAGYIFFAQRTGLLSWISVLGATTNLGLNYVMVPRYGALGAAQVTAVTFLLTFLLTWAVARRVHPMPWNLRTRSS